VEFDKLPLYVKDKEMGREMVNKLGDKYVILHRGHGAFITGATIEDVVIKAAALERAAKKQVIASSIGTPIEYDRTEVLKTYTKKIYEETAAIDWGYFVMRLQKTGTVL
jgi:ribulose-5-phosphate 4-epimerase/fuculose-1-phosphate aldolase